MHGTRAGISSASSVSVGWRPTSAGLYGCAAPLRLVCYVTTDGSGSSSPNWLPLISTMVKSVSLAGMMWSGQYKRCLLNGAQREQRMPVSDRFPPGPDHNVFQAARSTLRQQRNRLGFLIDMAKTYGE